MNRMADRELSAVTWHGVFKCGTGEVPLLVEATDSGVRAVRIDGGDAVIDAAAREETNAHLKDAVEQLREYFAGTRTVFDLPLDLKATPFQEQVWDTARQIPYGQTRSYWWVAVRMGNPHAFRAVGGALGANPVPIIIPCHRVVRENGNMGGFSCGIGWKKLLLGHESACASRK